MSKNESSGATAYSIANAELEFVTTKQQKLVRRKYQNGELPERLRKSSKTLVLANISLMQKHLLIGKHVTEKAVSTSKIYHQSI